MRTRYRKEGQPAVGMWEERMTNVRCGTDSTSVVGSTGVGCSAACLAFVSLAVI